MMISNNNNSVFVTERLQDSSEFRCTVSNEAGHSRSCDIITVLSKEHGMYITTTVKCF